MTTITIKTNVLRKIAPYILFLFTVLSFFFTSLSLLYIFISLAVIGFIFVNTTQIFLKERYLSYIEIFSSILLLVRLILIYSQGLFFVIIIGFILLNLVIFYTLNFSNYRIENTNILGIKKEKEYISRKKVFEDDFNDDLSEEEGLEEEDQDQLEEDMSDKNTEEENTDYDIDRSESIDDQLDDDLFEEEVKPKEKKTKKLISPKSKKTSKKVKNKVFK